MLLLATHSKVVNGIFGERNMVKRICLISSSLGDYWSSSSGKISETGTWRAPSATSLPAIHLLTLLHLSSKPSSLLEITCVLCAKSLQLCPTLCNTMDYSPPGSSVRGILQARILEWVAISFSRGSSWSNPCLLGLLHWQAGSLPPSHQGSPKGDNKGF